MRHLVLFTIALALTACGGGAAHPAAGADQPSAATPQPTAGGEGGAKPGAPPTAAEAYDSGKAGEFAVRTTNAKANEAEDKRSKIRGTDKEAALKLTVVDKEKGPMRGVVIVVNAENGAKYYAPETDTDGYTELLVPIGQKYELVYLSLGRHDVGAKLTVANEPRQNLRLTMRYLRVRPPKEAPEEHLVLDGVNFDNGKATLRPESYPRLDAVLEYMTHKPSSRIEISGHSDNVGKPATNKALSMKRAQACRDYLISKGIEAERIQAVGYGDERPIAPNDTEEGRQKNRRIEATEL